MRECLSFDDVLIVPKFSTITSRKNVNLSSNFLGLNLQLPIISSNMDTITEATMASAMALNGGIGALHRFNSIEQNVNQFKSTIGNVFVSIGIGDNEYERALALKEAGATHFIIDVAHGAATHVVEMYDRLREILPENCYIVVGNFATGESIRQFNNHIKSKRKPDAYKCGIGGGSNCSTRVITGCGLPTIASILDCSTNGHITIADGGILNSGDIAKALAAGASMVMIGNLLSGTNETPGEIEWSYDETGHLVTPGFKKYRGSASKESYEVQGKISEHRTPEGISRMVACKGPVKDILQQLEAGLKSSFTYVGASDMINFRENAELVRTTNSGAIESTPHGDK